MKEVNATYNVVITCKRTLSYPAGKLYNDEEYDALEKDIRTEFGLDDTAEVELEFIERTLDEVEA